LKNQTNLNIKYTVLNLPKNIPCCEKCIIALDNSYISEKQCRTPIAVAEFYDIFLRAKIGFGNKGKQISFSVLRKLIWQVEGKRSSSFLYQLLLVLLVVFNPRLAVARHFASGARQKRFRGDFGQEFAPLSHRHHHAAHERVRDAEYRDVHPNH
jgi:hypothetical protein